VAIRNVGGRATKNESAKLIPITAIRNVFWVSIAANRKKNGGAESGYWSGATLARCVMEPKKSSPKVRAASHIMISTITAEIPSAVSSARSSVRRGARISPAAYVVTIA
jgi:hypothetical protein